MFFFYSILYTIAFFLLSPLFIIRRRKYASGFTQRLGYVKSLEEDKRQTIWIHCVSVGETNAARPLVERLRTDFPNYRIVVSVTTATGYELANKLFGTDIEQVFYFPYDWKFSVRRSLYRIKPKIILVFETEIWFNFFRESSKFGARIFIVNGRLSEKSVKRYSWINKMMKRVLHYVDLALMQDHKDAKRLIQLGVRSSKVKVTGNLKFDQNIDELDSEFTNLFSERFNITRNVPLIIAASTHEPEEEIILAAFKKVWKNSTGHLPRLLIAPRHPERFDAVETLVRETGFDWAKRTEAESGRDKVAEVILLDSIGELRDLYSLGSIVFVGGSLVPHGGQSVLEPAFHQTAIIVGPHTENFAAIVESFVDKEALIQLPDLDVDDSVEQLSGTLEHLLANRNLRESLTKNSHALAKRDGGGTDRTIEYLRPYLKHKIAQNAEAED